MYGPCVVCGAELREPEDVLEGDRHCPECRKPCSWCRDWLGREIEIHKECAVDREVEAVMGIYHEVLGGI